MPKANENIIAKFMAQIDMGVSSLMSTKDPAEATSPAMVSVNGRPAATSAPKERTRIAKVTGHDSISDFSIEPRLALLKSDHITPAARPRHRGSRATPVEPCDGGRRGG